MKSIKYKFTLTILTLAALLIVSQTVLKAQDDPLIQALTDEMDRSVTSLHLEDEEPPYFLGYLVNLEDNCRIRAEYSSVIACDCQEANQMFLDLRVGDYEFDNTNVMTSFFGVGMAMANIPVGIAYTPLRKEAWLQTDRSYKRAVETIARKRAILQSVIPDDTIADLSKANVVVNIKPDVYSEVDTTEWKRTIADMSAVFEDYPQFSRSSVQLNTKTENRYVLNSEGTRVKRGRHVHFIFIEASTLDDNGVPVYQYDRMVVDDIDDFPSRQELVKWADDFAQTAAEMVGAETGDTYIGPVLFTPRASAQLFTQLFVDNISDPRKPLTMDNRFDQYLGNARFIRKLNFRIMPEFISIVDDPTMREYNGMELRGHYEFDDQGVPAERILLVEDGRLRSYYMSRTPTEKIKKSNGHGRLVQSMIGAVEVVGKPGNVIMQATETFDPEELKEQMVELCRELGIEYGLIIDRMNFSGRSNPDEGVRFRSAGPSGLPRVIIAYRVSAEDGSITPVRSLEFDNINERALKDILAVGNDFEETTIMFDLAFNNLASVVVPSILFEEMELKKASVQAKKQPIVLNPLERE
jgi:hypothetical protein